MSLSKFQTSKTVSKFRAPNKITSANKVTITPKSLATTAEALPVKTLRATPVRDRKPTTPAAIPAVISPRPTKTSTSRISRSNNNSSTSSYNRPPFKSFITTGLRTRKRSIKQSSDFAYDLSPDELRFMGSNNNSGAAMKAVPDGERELLKNGQRGAYLALRYEHSPDRKYNFPEATSWRIGWLHNQQIKQAVR